MWRRLHFPASTTTTAAPPPPQPASTAKATKHASDATDATETTGAPVVLTKTCTCGDITVRLCGDDWADGVPRGHLCFCRICRQSTGAHYAHSIEIPLRQPAIRLHIDANTPTGSLTTYRAAGLAAGTTSRRFFCRRCGDVVGGVAGHDPDTFMMRTGGFDAPTTPRPACQYLAAQMVEWLKDKIVDVPDGDAFTTWRVVGGEGADGGEDGDGNGDRV